MDYYVPHYVPSPKEPMVDLEFWDPDGRKEAAAAGQELVNALDELGIALDDIEIREPCSHCRRQDYLLSLGTINLATAREWAELLRKLAPFGDENAQGAGTR
ncbi:MULTISPECIES: hypothetical protein [Streptomyces]|uniref:Uncharacterized protein n=1 Tax=Streptomyces physcomitrii TaxID=2724184 RepID=A0ABX1H3B1_9ACTN|nr:MULTISPECIES: hypothetical protein [Streptomyces]NKI41774.1 hypothetical protein [Streptomyces physcomitrii]